MQTASPFPGSLLAKVLTLFCCLQKKEKCEDTIHPKQKRDLRKVRKQEGMRRGAMVYRTGDLETNILTETPGDLTLLHPEDL